MPSRHISPFISRIHLMVCLPLSALSLESKIRELYLTPVHTPADPARAEP